MSTKLALHWRPTHMDARDQEVITAWKPNSGKIINPSPYHAKALRAASPYTWITLRDHALSEQHDDMFNDPASTGVAHANRYREIVNEMGIGDERIIVTGINEPRIWYDGGIDATVKYNVAFLDRLHELGLFGGALNLSVGWPTNHAEGEPPDWEPFEPVREAIERGRHVLVLHEYWSKDGPQNNWGWWAGRYAQCPWDVPIIIGECGVDQYVAGAVPSESRGWAAWLNWEQYATQLAWYDDMAQRDARVHSVQIFTYDFDKPWGFFDLRQVREQFIKFIVFRGCGVPVDPWTYKQATTVYDLPEYETSKDPAILAEKVRWWLEEYTRQREQGINWRADQILYSMIDLDHGLLYRLENVLKGKPV